MERISPVILERAFKMVSPPRKGVYKSNISFVIDNVIEINTKWTVWNNDKDNWSALITDSENKVYYAVICNTNIKTIFNIPSDYEII